MKLNLWSDEERLFIPRTLGLSINFKHIARKFRWVKALPTGSEDTNPDLGPVNTNGAPRRSGRSG